MIVRLVRRFFEWRESVARKRLRWGPCFGDPTMLKLKKRVADGDNAAAEAALLIAGSDWVRRSWVCGVVTDGMTAMPTWVEEWCEAAPESANAFQIRGDAHYALAWKARGEGQASVVDRRAWPVWFRELSLAKDDYLRATELAPDDPVPWCSLIGTAVGLQSEAEEGDEYFREALVRDRRSYSAHSMMLHAKCEKWGGSHDEMFDFARRSAAAAPPGDPLYGLIARAHIERELYMAAFEGPTEAREAKDYWKRGDVVTELKRAYEKFARSINALPTPPLIGAKNVFGYALAAMKQKSEAKRLLRSLDRCVTEIPWCYCGFPAQTFETALEDGELV